MDSIIVALILALSDLVQIYIFIILVDVILSWTPLINTKFFHILEALTDPYLNIFRGFLKISSIDFSPIIGILILSFVSQILTGLVG